MIRSVRTSAYALLDIDNISAKSDTEGTYLTGMPLRP